MVQQALLRAKHPAGSMQGQALILLSQAFRLDAFKLRIANGEMIGVSHVSAMNLCMQRSVIVPPEEGYGKQGLLEIPPNATFELQVQVLSVR